VGRHEVVGIRQQLGPRQRGGTAGAEPEAPALPLAPLREAVRVGEGGQQARHLHIALSLPIDPELRPPVVGHLADVADGAVGDHVAAGVVGGGPFAPAQAVERLQSQSEVHVRRLALPLEDVALAEQGREVARHGPVAQRVRIEEHVGEAGMQPELGHLAAVVGNCAVAVDGPEASQEGLCLLVGVVGRRVEPAERRRVGRAPLCQLQGEGREVGVLDLRRGVRVEVVLRALRPEPVARAGGHAPGPPRALVGGGLRNAHGVEARHAGGGVEAGGAAQAAVHHHADALDGEARLGDVGGQDDLALPVRARRDGRVLLARREVAEEGVQGHVAGHVALQTRLGAPNFARAGQKDEHVPLGVTEHLLNHRRHRGREAVARADRLVGVVHLHRVAAALALNQGGIVDEARDGPGVERGAHDEHAQVGPEDLAGLEREGEPEVGLQVALVELVEQHRPHAL